VKSLDKNIITIRGGAKHDDLFKKIKEEAAKDGRSVNNYLLFLLANMFKPK